MITDYATLQTMILSWINRAGDSDAVSMCPVWVQMGENELKMAMSRMMIGSAETVDDTYLIDDAFNYLPDDFISMRDITIQTSPPKNLDYIPPNAVDRYKLLTDTVGTPDFYTIQGNQLRVISAPDTAYTATITYYSLPSLATAGTNWLLESYPKIYLYAGMVEAYDYYGASDKKAEKLADLNRMLSELEITGEQGNAASALQMRTDGMKP